MKKLLYLVIIAVIFLCGCACKPEAKVQHIVVCWLKEPGNEQACDELIKVSNSFTQIPGIVSVSAGKVLPSERPVVDDPFDFAVVIGFEDQQAMQGYLTHPIHQKAFESTFKPLVERFVVYNYIE